MKAFDRSSSLATAAGAFAAALMLFGTGCSLYFGEPLLGEPPDGTIVEPPDITDPATCRQELEEQGDVGMPFFPLELGPTVKAEDPPPAVSGGTMALSPDQSLLVAADPDRDQIYVMQVNALNSLEVIDLQYRDEPGRVVIDDSNRAHVALRRGGGFVSIDLTNNSIIGRREACAAPRGIDFDELTGALFLACHSGKLMTLDPATGALLDETFIEAGLRDVVVTSEHIYVSKFRTAELFVLNRDFEQLTTMKPPTLESMTFDPNTGEERMSPFEPSVAWRTIAHPDGGVVMMHQRGRADDLKPSGGGYGGDPCFGGALHSAVTPMQYGVETPTTAGLGFVSLPVDGALFRDNADAVVVSAGNMSSIGFELMAPAVSIEVNSQHFDFDCPIRDAWQSDLGGQVTSVVALADNTVILQVREPAQLRIYAPGSFWNGTVVDLDPDSRRDTGHQLFHVNPGSGVACAGCHPEGSDDGRVWDFQCIGERRTQPLHFGILGTEPFHWDGDMEDFTMLMTEVFVGRMSGEQPRTGDIELMGEWLDSVAPPPVETPANPSAVARGRALFMDTGVGCSSCHSGSKLISEGWFDVGTGGSFQVPSLVGLADREPYMHTGCAKTLRERFTNPACGGGDMHGRISHLSPAQIDDLIAYLETL